MTVATGIDGALRKLTLTSSADGIVSASLRLVDRAGAEQQLPLNGQIGRALIIEHLGHIRCQHCDTISAKSFGGGYCYRCFSTLARCDLCVMSPDRCHYHLGTCREPDWADGFCMRDHVVYVANTSGPKVGITRRGRELERWLDQGAVQALPVLHARTRRDAGLAEVAIAQCLSDKTDWRKLVSAEARTIELEAVADDLRARDLTLPGGVSWAAGERVRRFRYPVDRYPPRPDRLALRRGEVLTGNLLGIKGQYLLLSNGVLNVRRLVGHVVSVSTDEPLAGQDNEQLDLFGR